MNYKTLLDFCETDRQREVMESLEKTNSISKTASALKIDRRNVQRCKQRIIKLAKTRGMLGDLKNKGAVPEGFYAETSVKRRLNPETGEMDIIEDWTKSRRDKEAAATVIQAFVEGLAEDIKPAKKTKPLKLQTDQLATAIIIGDAHLGMLAHALETLDADHDLTTATEDLRAAIDYCVDCAPASNEGWFVNVGDFLHTNDSKHVTPGSGNLMDISSRHNQTMRAAGALIRYCISKMLTKFNVVKVINARGNHDEDAAFSLNYMLECVYEGEPRVEVQGNDSRFNFLEFGKNLVGINHGDKMNAHRLAGTMTRNQSEAFGRTKNWYYWLGHIHHETVKEHDSGIIMRSFPTLAPTDAWHADSGYGARSAITSITLHSEFGPVNEMAPTLDMIRALSK